MSKSKKDTKKLLSIQEDQPTNWFEPLYSKSGKDGSGIPWAKMEAHPSFAEWLRQNPEDGNGKSALVIGCGMGDDAVELEALGFDVTAFDVSATAIEYCKERFPHSRVDFLQADLLEDQPQWHRKFDFVLEIFTVQALPPKYEEELIRSISGYVAPAGQLLVIADVSDEPRDFANGPPWKLTQEHIDSFVSCGLKLKRKVVEGNPTNAGNSLLVTTFYRPSD